MGAQQDNLLQAAIEESLKEQQQPKQQKELPSEQFGKDQKQIQQPQIFTGAQFSFQSENQIPIVYTKFEFGPSADPELKQAVYMSLANKYEILNKITADSIILNFKLPDGRMQSWVFNKLDQVEDLYDFTKVKQIELDPSQEYNFYLSSNYPKRTYLDLHLTLQEANIETQTTLYVNKQ